MNRSFFRGKTLPSTFFGFFILALTILLLNTFPFKPISVVEARTAQQTNYTISFTTASSNQVEPTTNQDLDLTVEISPPITDTNLSITVQVQTINGSATAGSDYTAINNDILTFTSGDTNGRKTLSVRILEDDLEEPLENFFIQLLNPVSATLGSIASHVVTIPANDQPAATATPIATGDIPFIDAFEGNDTIQTAYTLDTVYSTGSNCLIDNATFWPAGDVDFYRFWAQGDALYTISTDQLSPGLDSVMTLYDPEGNVLGVSDDISPGLRSSSIQFTPEGDAWHYIGLINEDPSNPAGKKYCLKITEFAPSPTPTPSPTPLFQQTGQHDLCKQELNTIDNDSAQNACLITLSSADFATTDRNFVPREEGITDVDYYRFWVRENNFYTCTTSDLTEFNDTRMKFLNGELGLIAENDNIDASTTASSLNYLSTYTGWLYVLIEPAVGVEYRIADKYTYKLACSSVEVTPTFTPRPVQPGTGNGGGTRPTATPTPTIVEAATIDVLATVQAASTPTPPPTPIPNISINPLPTQPPPVTPVFATDLQVVLFYDGNNNNLPELDEGIVDMAVVAKEGNSDELLALGYTNQAGVVQFSLSPSSETINISIPYLGINQTVSVGADQLLIRVAPSILPNNLP